MESNKRGIAILAVLFLTTLAVFCAERKFLVAEKRGAGLSKYAKISWIDKVLLLVDDFEEMNADSSLQKEKFFAYGSAGISVDHSQFDTSELTSRSILKVSWKGNEAYGGWGKGVGTSLDIDAALNFLNFRIYIPKANGDNDRLKVIIEEEDNGDNILQKDKDDEWSYTFPLNTKDEWQLVSIPLKEFKDDNEGGDGIFNVTRKGGLHTIIFSFMQPDKYTTGTIWYFDFIFFSTEKIEERAVENNLN